MSRQLENIKVRNVREGEGAMPMSFALPGVTAQDLASLKEWYWSPELSLDPATATFHLEVRSYLMQVDGLNILIDTCCGNDKVRSVPWADRLQSPYLQNLHRLGLNPNDIHVVLCTHLHVDHVGWNTRLTNGHWVPTFPNARYVFGRKDYEFFSQQTHEAHHREAYLDSILPIVDAGLADIVESDHCVHREIEDGVWLEDATGHSPGCVVVNAQRGGSQAAFAGDVVHHPIQLVRPDTPFFADEDPALACVTRERLLNQWADTGAVIYPAHFPDEPAGHVRRVRGRLYYEFLSRCALLLILMLTLACRPAAAHHSFAVFFDTDSQLRKITGVVKEFRFTNPHGVVTLAVAEGDHQVIWRAETNSPSILRRRGWTADSLHVGEKITVEGWLARDGSKYLRLRAATRANGEPVGKAPTPVQEK